MKKFIKFLRRADKAMEIIATVIAIPSMLLSGAFMILSGIIAAVNPEIPVWLAMIMIYAGATCAMIPLALGTSWLRRRVAAWLGRNELHK